MTLFPRQPEQGDKSGCLFPADIKYSAGLFTCPLLRQNTLPERLPPSPVSISSSIPVIFSFSSFLFHFSPFECTVTRERMERKQQNEWGKRERREEGESFFCVFWRKVGHLAWQAVIRAVGWCSALTTGRDKHPIIVLEQLLWAALCVSVLLAVCSFTFCALAPFYYIQSLYDCLARWQP